MALKKNKTKKLSHTGDKYFEQGPINLNLSLAEGMVLRIPFKNSNGETDL